MAGNKRINYKNCLEIFKKLYFPIERIEDSAIELVSNLLNDVNSMLISCIEAHYSSIARVNGQTFHNLARKVIDENFPEDLKTNALSEAYKQLALLESGCITFGEKGTESKIKTNGTKRSTREEIELQRIETSLRLFKIGIGKMCPNIVPNMKVNSNAMGSLAFYIHEFCKMVAERTPEKFGQKEELTPVDLKHILTEYLKDGVQRTAISEGSKSVALYENDLIEFKPRKTYESEWSRDSILSEKIFNEVFKPGIRILLNEIDPCCEADLKAQRYLGHILMDIARYIAEHASKTCRKEKIFEMKDDELQSSVSVTFPQQLKELALVKGTKDVMDFQSGMISYERTDLRQERSKSESSRKKTKREKQRPKKQARVKKSIPKSKRKSSKSSRIPKTRRASRSPKRSQASRKRRSKSPPTDKVGTTKSKKTDESQSFATVLTSSAKKSFSRVNVSLERENARNLSQVLEQVCKVLIDISVSHAANSDELDEEDVEAALLELFPEGLATHALSVASNAVSSYCDGVED